MSLTICWRSSAAGDEPIGVTGVKFNTMPTSALGDAAADPLHGHAMADEQMVAGGKASGSERRPGACSPVR